ncbi:MAG TPA: hypothetical protein VK536_06295 [Candidatus Limnocylindrales bacterium]|nr:hypothetical protein [Candidatus Limnocylindrales bacterium]
MANITIEYMILIPVLILQIFLLPYAASAMMSYWTTSSETITLQDAASHIGSTIQQFYLFINNPTLSTTTITDNLGIPQFINGNAYVGKASLSPVSSSEQVLNLTLSLIRTSISTFSIVDLGQNVHWNSSCTTFTSNSLNPSINALKYSNGTILLYFSA